MQCMLHLPKIARATPCVDSVGEGPQFHVNKIARAPTLYGQGSGQGCQDPRPACIRSLGPLSHVDKIVEKVAKAPAPHAQGRWGPCPAWMRSWTMSCPHPPTPLRVCARGHCVDKLMVLCPTSQCHRPCPALLSKDRVMGTHLPKIAGHGRGTQRGTTPGEQSVCQEPMLVCLAAGQRLERWRNCLEFLAEPEVPHTSATSTLCLGASLLRALAPSSTHQDSLPSGTGSVFSLPACSSSVISCPSTVTWPAHVAAPPQAFHLVFLCSPFPVPAILHCPRPHR
ncbi:hypothetical protein P7K49_012281 [Saguinus oedipus]|uniref:Uncharacterized protein n=1 Tax=Saguinus oedipus TaxID=9490 RepID=A0ABQ9VT31_SAGOE|nr:hypothetical protein P7K49_012281 [Saguinus oedipus]